MNDKNDFDWKEHILECLNSTDYCCLSTVDLESGVWSNPVYFAWDAQFNFYFISQMSSRHMQNISQDSKVSLSIYKTEQKGDVLGIQLEGEAVILEEQENRQKAHEVYYGRKGSLEQNEFALHDPKWFFVKITPRQIYYFNSLLFDEERQTVPMDKLLN